MAQPPSRGLGLREKFVMSAIALVLVAEAIQEVLHMWTKTKRSASGWWADVERSERRRHHQAELGFLAKTLAPGRAASAVPSSLAGGGGRRGRGGTGMGRTQLLGVLGVTAALLVAACSSDSSTTTGDGPAAVTAAEKGLTQANATFEEAAKGFCDDAKTYIEAVDRYGKVLTDQTATVGDVQTLGADLGRPRDAVASSAEGVTSARAAVVKAQETLTDARASAAASGASTTVPPTTTTTPTPTSIPAATVDRVKKAESQLSQTQEGITAQTPLAEATAQYNAAAFALEVSWLRLFADAGCLTDDQEAKAVASVADYTSALQTALTVTGYYKGPVDGVYGPETVDAVEQLQTAAGLTVTGLVDEATATALNAAILKLDASNTKVATSYTAAVQSTLKLAGYWTGPVDGTWTDELTDALKSFQTELGVPATGAVDAATLAALEQAIAAGKTAAAETTTTTTAEEPAATTTTTAG